MHKILYSFILLFSISTSSQNYKYGFSSRYPVTVGGNGDYIKGAEEKVEGYFFFDLSYAVFELDGSTAGKLDLYKIDYEDGNPDVYEIITVHSLHSPSSNFEIKLYQFLDRKIPVFSSYAGKNYLYIINRAVAEDGTVYSVKT